MLGKLWVCKTGKLAPPLKQAVFRRKCRLFFCPGLGIDRRKNFGPVQQRGNGGFWRLAGSFKRQAQKHGFTLAAEQFLRQGITQGITSQGPSVIQQGKDR